MVTNVILCMGEGSDMGGNHVHLHRNQLEIRVRNQKSNSSARNQKSDNTRIGRGASESRSKFRILSYSHSTGVCRACARPAVDVMTSEYY